jgi:hypothetical protein
VQRHAASSATKLGYSVIDQWPLDMHYVMGLLLLLLLL